MMALSWPVTVLVTAVLAVLCSMCIYTEYEYTISVPVKATADDAFKYLQDPMVIKELHPPIVSLEISSQHEIQDPPGWYYDMAVVETIPVLGDHALRNQVWYDMKACSITNMAHVFWGLLVSNVTWTVVSDGDTDTGTCYIEEHGVTRLPWILSSRVKAEQERNHLGLLNRAVQVIETHTNKPENEP